MKQGDKVIVVKGDLKGTIATYAFKADSCMGESGVKIAYNGKTTIIPESYIVAVETDDEDSKTFTVKFIISDVTISQIESVKDFLVKHEIKYKTNSVEDYIAEEILK